MSDSQTHTLHRALLRPLVIHTLRAAGFSGTKSSVLDTLTNITERYILLLASTTAQHALNSHNDPIPTLSDVRMAMQDCGALTPVDGSAEEEWREIMRRPVEDYAGLDGGLARAEKIRRMREEEDLRDIRAFLRWFDGAEHKEIKRVAGMAAGSAMDGSGAGAVVGVGGGVVREEDFLEKLKKRYSRAGDDARLQGTVLGKPAEARGVVVEGGPVGRISEWRPKKVKLDVKESEGAAGRDVVMTAEAGVT